MTLLVMEEIYFSFSTQCTLVNAPLTLSSNQNLKPLLLLYPLGLHNHSFHPTHPCLHHDFVSLMLNTRSKTSSHLIFPHTRHNVV